MRLLLDTHVFLWAVSGSARLKALTEPLRLLTADKVLAQYSDVVLLA